MNMVSIDQYLASLSEGTLVASQVPDSLRLTQEEARGLMHEVRDDIAGNAAMRSGSVLAAAMMATR